MLPLRLYSTRAVWSWRKEDHIMYGPHIEGARVTLAPPLPSYVDDYLRWFSDPAVTRYLNLRNPPSREQEEEFLRRMAAADTEEFLRRMAAADTEEFLRRMAAADPEVFWA